MIWPTTTRPSSPIGPTASTDTTSTAEEGATWPSSSIRPATTFSTPRKPWATWKATSTGHWAATGFTIGPSSSRSSRPIRSSPATTRPNSKVPARPTRSIVTRASYGYLTKPESGEHLWVFLSHASGAEIGRSMAGGTIIDNDRMPQVDVSNTSVTAGEDARFRVSLSNPYSQAVTVDYAAVSNTATVGSDFKATEGTIRFEPGETMAVVSVPTLVSVAAIEQQDFSVVLSSPQNATIDDGNGTGEITPKAIVVGPAPLEIPLAPLAGETATESLAQTSSLFLPGGGGVMAMGSGEPTVNIYGMSDTEGDTLEFTVELIDPDSDVTVSYYTYDDTATDGDDYYGDSSSVTLSSANTEEKIYISTVDDGLDEEDYETFNVYLSDAPGAEIGTSTARRTVFGVSDRHKRQRGHRLLQLHGGRNTLRQRLASDDQY